MRRLVVLTVATAVGVLAWARYKGRRPAISKPVSGISHNGMAYVRWGTGQKNLLVISGGPDNTTPKGSFLSKHLRVARPLVEDSWTAWVVTRKQRLPQGYSIADMADDYSRLIEDEFGGRVDAVLGISTGGMIGLQLAARHPECLGRMAVVATAYVVDGPRREADLAYARLLHEGRPAAALTSFVRAVYPRMRVPGVAWAAGTLFGPLVLRGVHASFRDDVLVEAEAEMAFDAKAILPDIPIPVLLIGGGADQFFTQQVIEETAQLIPDCTLRIYEGNHHLATVMDERLPKDVFDFIAPPHPTGPANLGAGRRDGSTPPS